jgi:hypothetical protein
MPRPCGNEETVAGREPAFLPIEGGHRFALNDDPVLRPAVVILKRKPCTRRDHDQLYKEPVVDMQDGIGPPGTLDGRRRIMSVKDHAQNEIA